MTGPQQDLVERLRAALDVDLRIHDELGIQACVERAARRNAHVVRLDVPDVLLRREGGRAVPAAPAVVGGLRRHSQVTEPGASNSWRDTAFWTPSWPRGSHAPRGLRNRIMHGYGSVDVHRP